MGRIAIWSINTCLFVLCCWLVAANLNQAASAMLAPAQMAPSDAARGPTTPLRRSFAERQVILDRNLFDVSSLVPEAEPVEQTENLEDTQLNLRLLGTAASSRSELSWAAVEDQDQRKKEVLQIGDTVAGARVLEIEARLIVLDNRGRREKLAFDEEPASGRAPQGARAARPRTSRRPASNPTERVRRLAENRFQVNREDVVELAGRNPAEIFSSARILPKYEDGQMVGIQLNNVKDGSLFQDIGIQNGDIITQFNGIQINSPQGSAEVLRELTQADRFELSVTGADGSARTLTYEVAE